MFIMILMMTMMVILMIFGGSDNYWDDDDVDDNNGDDVWFGISRCLHTLQLAQLQAVCSSEKRAKCAHSTFSNENARPAHFQMEQIFKTVMVTGAGIARPPVRASSIPLWKQYLVFSIFHLEEIQCTQTDPRDDHLNQDKAHLHLQRFSNLSFEFTFIIIYVR